MANIIEKTGKSYNIFDKINNVWNKCSFWTHSNDVFYPDGKSATTKHSAINGITSDLSGEAEDIAASIKCVNQLNSSLTANSNQFHFDYQDGKYGFNTDPNRGADTFHPFKIEPDFTCVFNDYSNDYVAYNEKNALVQIYNRLLLQSNQTTYCYALCACKNPIDLSGYKRIILRYTCKIGGTVGISSTLPASVHGTGDLYSDSLNPSTSITEKIIDISEINAIGYLFFMTNLYTSEISIHSIVLSCE